MQPIVFEFNYQTGDIGYLYKRDEATPDGYVNHRGMVMAGDSDALQRGCVYSNDAIANTDPTILTVSFPTDIVTQIQSLWAKPEIQKVISDRLVVAQAAAAQADQQAAAQAAADAEAAAAEQAKFNAAVAAAVAQIVKPA